MFAEAKKLQSTEQPVHNTLYDQSISSLAGRKTIEESLVHRKIENEDAGWSVRQQQRGTVTVPVDIREQLEGN